MAAYAALRSLMYIIHQIKHHPRPPISLDNDQVESLIENLTLFLKFLEDKSPRIGYSHEADLLEMRMADSAYAAEDVIEPHIVDQIHVGSKKRGKEISSIGFCKNLQKVIIEMDAIKEVVMEINEKKMGVLQDQQHAVDCPSSSSVPQNVKMVGFDDVVLEVIEKLMGQHRDLQIIPIVGMGGIGKTTLAQSLIENQHVRCHFDICAWVAISQEYNTREILRELLYQVTKKRRDSSEGELGLELYQYLSGRRYMIVLDDMWSIEAWDKIKFFFPGNEDGSRIVVTTRLLELASQLTNSYRLKMTFLDDDRSWDLFSNTVFGGKGCPVELEEIGKKIVAKCKGLPLSIVVIGGLLAKGKHTHAYWEYIAENLNSIVNSENNGNCLNILSMSYNQLPVHLKPCFLYMGVYPEDRKVRIRILVNLLVAEGFVRPVTGKSLEEVAKEYIEELIERNLFIFHTSVFHGLSRRCSMHDLLRDFCLREAEKEGFYNVVKQRSADLMNTQQRRISISQNTPQEGVIDALHSGSLTRSLTWDIDGDMSSINCRLLRVLNTCLTDQKHGGCPPKIIFQLVNARYLSIRAHSGSKKLFPVCIPWNLHTLVINGERWEKTPLEIWKMPQLRHVMFRKGVVLTNPPDGVVLESLQTLKTVLNFKCDEEMVKRIPNVTKLSMGTAGIKKCSLRHCLLNLERLQKLRTFSCYVAGFVKTVSFSHSLLKLDLLVNYGQYWEDIVEKIGVLPLLEYLRMTRGSFRECKWETEEGRFPRLKYLEFGECRLDNWTTDSTHFPRLEHLVISDNFGELEIPSCIGDIPTIRVIRLVKCSYSEALSAKRIQEEQMEYGNESLQVYAIMRTQKDKERALENMACRNFRVFVYGILLIDQERESHGPRSESDSSAARPSDKSDRLRKSDFKPNACNIKIVCAGISQIFAKICLESCQVTRGFANGMFRRFRH